MLRLVPPFAVPPGAWRAAASVKLLDLLPMSKKNCGRVCCRISPNRSCTAPFAATAPHAICFPPVRSGALRAVFISRRREWRLQPAASSVTKHRARGSQPPLAAPPRAQFSCLCFSNFSCPRTSYLIIVAERSRILSSWRASAPPTMMRVWFRTLFTRIPAGVCWCTCLRPAANTVQEAAIRIALTAQ